MSDSPKPKCASCQDRGGSRGGIIWTAPYCMFCGLKRVITKHGAGQ